MKEHAIQHAAARDGAQQETRKAFAAEMEDRFLGGGIDVHVSARGRTLLIADYPGCDRAFVYQVLNGKHQDLFRKLDVAWFRRGLRKAGFKRFECGDGFGNGAYQDLN